MEKTLYEHIGVFNGCPRSTVISGKEYQIYTNMNDGEDGELEEYMETDIRNNSYGIPQSTVVACALTTCLENEKPILRVITDYVKFTVIDGAPGTSCPSGRKANSKGLCYVGSDQKKFVRKGVLQQVGDAMDHTFGWG
ncbi:hypothetical protein GCK72_013106 [Caenorhabditis remanei]|uniref:Uncharacterized protein n=1 Tax=Caenorhabditis remanei TaxID=31234 RepID=A0A6A5GQJ4_CAERE|nr:hypothetical protein GCK72_013106 [Caenorhabditis remanei]KAF1756652.1 hypothetical protein GCK72_013106 [Caenorhabditis remanei]